MTEPYKYPPPVVGPGFPQAEFNRPSVEGTQNFVKLLERIKAEDSEPVSAIYVTSGGIKLATGSEVVAGTDLYGAEGIRYSTTAIGDPDPRKSLGWGKAKVIAAAQLGFSYPKTWIYPLSRSTNNNTSYSDAMVAGNEIRAINKINPVDDGVSNGYSGPLSFDSFSELLYIVDQSGKRRQKHVVVVTTSFQKPRIEAMLHSILNMHTDPQELAKVEQMLAFNKRRFHQSKFTREHGYFTQVVDYYKTHKPELVISFVTAEEVLPSRDRHYEKYIEAAVATPIYQEKLAQDLAAADQWRSGEYGKPR